MLLVASMQEFTPAFGSIESSAGANIESMSMHKCYAKTSSESPGDRDFFFVDFLLQLLAIVEGASAPPSEPMRGCKPRWRAASRAPRSLFTPRFGSALALPGVASTSRARGATCAAVSRAGPLGVRRASIRPLASLA
jgi:hypothetical protein